MLTKYYLKPLGTPVDYKRLGVGVFPTALVSHDFRERA